jgi:hypothetical protein
MPIKVRVNQGNQQTVHNTTTFVGAGAYENQITVALQIANSAYIIANSAFAEANTKVSRAGDTMTGPLFVNSYVTANSVFSKFDGGEF